jgi:autotransporter translocation and assembly factor TamB
MTITKFLGRNSGGSFSGSASLKWVGGWSIDGTVNAKQIDTKKLAPALLTGRVDGKAAFAMQAKDARSLFAVPHMEGSFVVGQGELLGVDLMHLLQNTADSGKTGFRELGGTFVHNGDVTQIRQLRLDAGIISASGSAELSSNDMVRGRFAAAYRFDNLQAHANVVLSGKVSAPQFSR